VCETLQVGAEASEVMIRVQVLRKSMYGGYMGKVYEFKNRRHMENWLNKWAVRLGVDQWNVIKDTTKTLGCDNNAQDR
jgi:hypothetical protein